MMVSGMSNTRAAPDMTKKATLINLALGQARIRFA